MYLDAEAGLPEWAMTRTGILGTNARFVPLVEARLEDRGVAVPYEGHRQEGSRDRGVECPALAGSGTAALRALRARRSHLSRRE